MDLRLLTPLTLRISPLGSQPQTALSRFLKDAQIHIGMYDYSEYPRTINYMAAVYTMDLYVDQRPVVNPEGTNTST